MRKIFLVLLLLTVGYELEAQSAPAAYEPAGTLWAGGEISLFNPDYSCVSSNIPFACSNDMVGAGAVVKWNLSSKLAADGEARWLRWNGAHGQLESTYLAGPQYSFWSHQKLSLAGKFLVGGGWFSAPFVNGSYFVYAPGAELSYRQSRRLQYFVDYEYQWWPSFVGPSTVSSTGQLIQHNHGISPNGFSFGVKYRVF